MGESDYGSQVPIIPVKMCIFILATILESGHESPTTTTSANLFWVFKYFVMNLIMVLILNIAEFLSIKVDSNVHYNYYKTDG